MEGYHFSICQIGLELLTDGALVVAGDMPLFHREQVPAELTVRCRKADGLHPEGELLERQRERLILRRGGEIVRCRTAGERICSALAYRPAEPGQALLTVEGADWHWATDHLRLWSTLWLNHLLLGFRSLTFHASYIAHEGKGILFTAPSGIGKSTQAELWRVHRGAQIINGDKAAIRLGADGPMVHGLPFAGTSGICNDKSAPLGAVVVLSQAPENAVRRLSPSQAVAALCPNVFVDQVVPEEWQMALQLLLDLVATVPVYSLACTPDVRAVETLEAALANE